MVRKSENYLGFTTAKLETYNGKKLFVVSRDTDDIFLVQNNASKKDAIPQDICYSPGHGFFVPRWYGDENQAKTVILWADIDGEHSTKTIGTKTYRYYIPNKINVNKSNDSYTYNGGSCKIFKTFEFESIAFTYDGDMLFSCNIEETAKYSSLNAPRHVDSVYKLTHDNGQQFTLN